MAKRGRNKKPVHIEQHVVPIYIPTEDGYGDLELGQAHIRGNTLIVEFNTKLPSVAIKNRIERGEIVGLTFVIPPDEAEEARRMEAQHQAELAKEQEEETEEERARREEEEAQQAKVDEVFLNAELERLEDD